QTLRRRGFDVDLPLGDFEECGQPAAHLVSIGQEPGRLRQYGDVGVRYAKSALAKHFQDGANESLAVRVAPLRVGVRKMDADVTETSGSEHGVAERMQDDVPVGMSHDPSRVRHAH